jgi:hypothetical protein
MKINRKISSLFQDCYRGSAFLILLLLFARSVRAQDFSFDDYSLNPGGGQSSGGDFELSGTISQPDAGDLVGGNFALSGGFWGVVAGLTSTAAPALSVAANGSSVIVSWPQAEGDGFVLEATGALDGLPGGPVWTRVDVTPQAANGTLTVRLPLTAGNQFYRLHKF